VCFYGLTKDPSSLLRPTLLLSTAFIAFDVFLAVPPTLSVVQTCVLPSPRLIHYINQLVQDSGPMGYRHPHSSSGPLVDYCVTQHRTLRRREDCSDKG
jgi:hypothetical protein